MEKIDMAFICDRKECDDCWMDCKHTAHIEHAKNFEKIGDAFWEKDNDTSALDALRTKVENQKDQINALVKQNKELKESYECKLQLYKKAFDLMSQEYFNSQGGFYFDDIDTLKEKYLNKAQEDLNNGK